VSGQLAKANFDAVDALANAAVLADPANAAEADEALSNAGEIVHASSPIWQILMLGIPSALIEANTLHINKLASSIPGEPEAENAFLHSSKLAGQDTKRKTYMAAAEGTPLGKKILDSWEAIASGLVGLYGLTRGKGHFLRWWNSPGKDVPPPPNSDKAASTKVTAVEA